jgi:hypothetical protein
MSDVTEPALRLEIAHVLFIDIVGYSKLLPAAGFPVGGDESITLADLRQRWEWDPLRNNPRFQKILAGPEPATSYK